MLKAFIITDDMVETVRFTLTGICGFQITAQTALKALESAQRVAPDQPPAQNVETQSPSPKPLVSAPANPSGREALAEIVAGLEGVTQGLWYPGHLGSDSTCQCRSIVDDGGYMGAIATVHVGNGLPIGEGGNDAPPVEEAAANMRHIARCDPDTMRAISAYLAAVEQERDTAQYLTTAAVDDYNDALAQISALQSRIQGLEEAKPITLAALKDYFVSLAWGDVPDPATALYSYLLMDGYILKTSAASEVRAALNKDEKHD